MPDAGIEKFLVNSTGWITKKRTEVADRLAKIPKLNSSELFYRGEIWRFVHIPARSYNTKTDYNNKTISSGKILNGKDLNNWYKKEALFYLTSRVAALAGKYGYKYSKIKVREAKKRWGTCSTKGTISLNSKLILAPTWVSDAIIMHELCHTVHHNHGESFYNTLYEICPKWDDAKKWLKDNYDFIETIWEG